MRRVVDGLDGDSLVFIISECEVHILEALCGGTLVEVVDGGAYDDTFAGAVDSKATNLNVVLVLDGLDDRSFADNLDELLAGVSVLVDLANITRCHLLVQGNVDSQVNTTEPGGDMGHESSGCTEVVANLSLMDVACEGVGQ